MILCPLCGTPPTDQDYQSCECGKVYAYNIRAPHRSDRKPGIEFAVGGTTIIRDFDGESALHDVFFDVPIRDSDVEELMREMLVADVLGS